MSRLRDYCVLGWRREKTANGRNVCVCACAGFASLVTLTAATATITINKMIDFNRGVSQRVQCA